MLSLNSDILLDVVAEIDRMYEGKELIDALTKFMLSGKEPFAATLKFFSKADCVRFDRGGFQVLQNNCSFFDVPYVFTLLQPIIKVLLQNVAKINVHECPNYYTKEFRILKSFISENLKEMETTTYLPATFMKYRGIKLDKIKVNVSSSSLSQTVLQNFFMVPAAIHEVKSQIDWFPEFSSKWIFEKVENLRIGRICIDENVVKKFIKILSISFPNLKKIQVMFIVHENFWISGFESRIEPKLFKGIPSRIKGKIWITDKSNINQSFDIHNGLSVEVINDD